MCPSGLDHSSLWYVHGELDSRLCAAKTARLRECTPRRSEEWEGDRKEGHPPFQRPINPTLQRGDDCRRNPVTGCVSQDSFIPAAPYVHVSRLPPDPGWWQIEIGSQHKRADKKHNFPLHCRSLLQLSTAAPACTDAFPEAAMCTAYLIILCLLLM